MLLWSASQRKGACTCGVLLSCSALVCCSVCLVHGCSPVCGLLEDDRSMFICRVIEDHTAEQPCTEESRSISAGQLRSTPQAHVLVHRPGQQTTAWHGTARRGRPTHCTHTLPCLCALRCHRNAQQSGMAQRSSTHQAHARLSTSRRCGNAATHSSVAWHSTAQRGSSTHQAHALLCQPGHHATQPQVHDVRHLVGPAWPGHEFTCEHGHVCACVPVGECM